MLIFNNANEAKELDDRILELLVELDALTGSTEEYSETADNLAKLIKLRNEMLKLNSDTQLENDKFDLEKDQFTHEKEKLLSWRPSPDAIIAAAASVTGILFVLHFEKLGVVTSKALGFISKMK